MKDKIDLDAALKEAGAVLIRTGRHDVYKLANGRRIAVSVSPSDKYAVNQAVRQIRRLMRGLQQ
jgi:hypothetical protein